MSYDTNKMAARVKRIAVQELFFVVTNDSCCFVFPLISGAIILCYLIFVTGPVKINRVSVNYT